MILNLTIIERFPRMVNGFVGDDQLVIGQLQGGECLKSHCICDR